MLVPSDMIGPQSKLLFQVNKFYGDRVHARKYTVCKTIREICKIVQDVLKEVEVQEPRFISSLTEINGRYEGLDVVSPHEFEVVLYLNQMGVFNFSPHLHSNTILVTLKYFYKNIYGRAEPQAFLIF